MIDAIAHVVLYQIFRPILKPFKKSLMAFASPAVKNGVLFARGSEPMHVFLPGFGTAW